MKAKPKRSTVDEVWLMGSEGADVISLKRLEAVVRVAPLADRPKRELLDLINYVRVQETEKKRIHRRPIDQQRRLCAGIVGVLIEKHGIKKDAAVSAMVREGVGTEEERRKRRAVIYRAHTAQKASGETIRVLQSYVNAALALINPPRNRK